MGKNKDIEINESTFEWIKKFFAVTDAGLFEKWGDTFEIEADAENKIVVIYSGSDDIKHFKKECKDILEYCVSAALGKGKKTRVKISQKSSYNAISPKTQKNIKAAKFFVIGMLFVCIATAIIIVLLSYIGNRNFKETFYSTSSIKVDSNVRIIQISDLHGVSYGKDNQKLLERVKELKPDIILCTGDIVDSAKNDVDYAVKLAEKLVKIAPSYYIYGNNEVESLYDFTFNEKELDDKFGFTKDNRDETALLKLEDSFEKQLEAVGIKVLKNEKDTLKVKTMNVDIYGVLTSNPSSFWSYTEKSFADYIYNDNDNFKITAIHEPTIFEEFNPEFWGDLMVSGHTHGGVIRVPVLGPLYTHEGGLFPERSGDFVYGRYDTAGSPLIVSSGLENSDLLRINNPPELVIIDVNKF